MKRLPTPLSLVLFVILAAGGLYLVARPVSAQEHDDTDPPGVVSAPAAPSQTLFSYQGELLDSAGNPITDAAMPMTFKLYNALTGGTACWTENQTVNVETGKFNILLGQYTAIDTTCLTGDVYLEIVVNGETLSPRELLPSVPFAVESSTVTAGAATQGDLTINGGLTLSRAPDGNKASFIDLFNNTTGNKWRIPVKTSSNDALLFTFYDNLTSSWNETLQLSTNGNVQVPNGGVKISRSDGGYIRLENGTTNDLWQLDMKSAGDDRLIMSFRDESASTWTSALILSPDGSCSTAAASSTIVATSDDGALLCGSVAAAQLSANSLTSGAYVEANLMTPDERNIERIARFTQGDLLCWSAGTERLEKCAQANDRLVMAVADSNGKPIVIGAEPIKVIGPVQAGDLLVTSDESGYAMVNNNPAPGTVIGQAIQSFTEDRGIIKAMIRKW